MLGCFTRVYFLWRFAISSWDIGAWKMFSCWYHAADSGLNTSGLMGLLGRVRSRCRQSLPLVPWVTLVRAKCLRSLSVFPSWSQSGCYTSGHPEVAVVWRDYKKEKACVKSCLSERTQSIIRSISMVSANNRRCWMMPHWSTHSTWESVGREAGYYVPNYNWVLLLMKAFSRLSIEKTTSNFWYVVKLVGAS